MKERPEIMWFLLTNEEESEIVSTTEMPKMRHSGGKWTGSSGWYSSREELIEKCGVPERPCVHCGRVFSTQYIEPVKSELLKHNRCHTCNFWIEKFNEPTAIVVGGCHYTDGGQKDVDTRWNGFGGKVWKYQKFGQEPQTTNNMWFQGEIPERFRAQIPDNAIFLR